MTEVVLTEIEQTRRRELRYDTKAAIGLGLTYDEYIVKRDQTVDRWIKLFYAEMERLHTDDPTEVLPNLMAKLEERAIAEARRAAQIAARDMVATMLRRAIT